MFGFGCYMHDHQERELNTAQRRRMNEKWNREKEKEKKKACTHERASGERGSRRQISAGATA